MANTSFSDNGISEQAAITLILIMVIGLAGIIAAVFFDILSPVSKTGYLVPKAELGNGSGYQVIQLHSLAGDSFSLNESGKESGHYRLGTRLETGNGSHEVQVSPAISRPDFCPGDTVYIYQSGTTPVLTDSMAGVIPTGDFPKGSLALVLNDDTSHVLLARIELAPGTGGSATPAPVPTPTPDPFIPAGTALLNAEKGGYLMQGGALQFKVTGPWSYITFGKTPYDLNIGDTVRMVIESNGPGKVYASTGQITTFSYSDVSVYVNGIAIGRGAIGDTGIYISGYSDQVSTLSVTVPASGGWTNFVTDSTTHIRDDNSSVITITGIKGPANLDIAPGRIWYQGDISGYTIS